MTCYEVHDWSGAVGEGNAEIAEAGPAVDATACHHIFDKLVILADGSVALCFEDILEAGFGLGNAIDAGPIELFNSDRFNKIRRLHDAGKRCQMKLCGQCAVLRNESRR